MTAGDDGRRVFDKTIGLGVDEKIPTVVDGWRPKGRMPSSVGIHQMDRPFTWGLIIEASEARTLAATLLAAADAAES